MGESFDGQVLRVVPTSIDRLVKDWSVSLASGGADMTNPVHKVGNGAISRDVTGHQSLIRGPPVGECDRGSTGKPAQAEKSGEDEAHDDDADRRMGKWARMQRSCGSRHHLYWPIHLRSPFIVGCPDLSNPISPITIRQTERHTPDLTLLSSSPWPLFCPIQRDARSRTLQNPASEGSTHQKRGHETQRRTDATFWG